MSRKTKFRSIRWTIIFLVMGLFAAMGTIMFSFALPMLRNTALDAAKHQAMMVAQEQAGNVAAKLSSAFKIPHVIAGTLKTNKIDNTGFTREQVNKILREQLASNSEIFGVYTAWEPNAYDDKDGEYINNEGHDATGRFVPYWFRNPDNSLGLTALLDYDVDGPGDYYQVPKKTKKNSLIEPYLYNAGGRDVLMTSLIVPIVVDGQFLGMSGVDILLESLQTGVDEINIYDGQATVTIYSNTGLIVAMKGSPEMIGKPLKELGGDSDRVLDIIKSGKSEQYETGGNLSVFAPLIVGDTDTPWLVNITIPLSKVTEVADRNTWQLLVICAVLMILLPLALWWVSGLITSPIKLVAEGAQRLAIGDADMIGIDKNRLANLLKRNDELGLVGNSFTDLIQYFKDTSSAAQSIAGGDLTITIEAKSDEDMLGNAFVQMVKALRETVGQVSQNATNLKTAAEHLSTASVQSGQASNQIAATISQIAKGTTQQTESTTRTAAAIEQLTRAVDGVAHGAQEQSAAINQTSDVLGLLSEAVKSIQHGADQQSEAITHSQGEMKRLSAAMEEIRVLSQEASHQLEKTSQTSAGFREALKRLDETAGRVNSVVKSSEQAATNGAEIVSRSTQDMATVQKTSEDLADKVADLGRNAAQMDAILSTIDDIASRTNLLALNAAIEAARAGEHGRGFSVVADEVRKLAEKSTEATKEIAEILRSLQESANATSQSMQQTSEDVARAGQAVVEAHATFQSIVSAASESVASVDAIRTALESLRQTGEEFIGVINSTAQSSQQNQRSAEEMVTLNQAVTQRMNEVTQVAESNLQATRKMVELNNQMIERMDSISAIVEENTASSEEMSASAKSVTEMIENIASVSEENSASVEEVSAGTEEMSAQTEEVSASAQDLNAMAENLSRVVAQFRLAGDEEHLVSTSR